MSKKSDKKVKAAKVFPHQIYQQIVLVDRARHYLRNELLSIKAENAVRGLPFDAVGIGSAFATTMAKNGDEDLDDLNMEDWIYLVKISGSEAVVMGEFSNDEARIGACHSLGGNTRVILLSPSIQGSNVDVKRSTESVPDPYIWNEMATHEFWETIWYDISERGQELLFQWEELLAQRKQAKADAKALKAQAKADKLKIASIEKQTSLEQSLKETDERKSN